MLEIRQWDTFMGALLTLFHKPDIECHMEVVLCETHNRPTVLTHICLVREGVHAQDEQLTESRPK